jgi:hypothetical protein
LKDHQDASDMSALSTAIKGLIIAHMSIYGNNH